MLTTLAGAFMTATRMDAFAGTQAPALRRTRAPGRTLAARALAALARLAR